MEKMKFRPKPGTSEYAGAQKMAKKLGYENVEKMFEEMETDNKLTAKVILYGMLATRDPFIAAMQVFLLGSITGLQFKDVNDEVEYYANAMNEEDFVTNIAALAQAFKILKGEKNDND